MDNSKNTTLAISLCAVVIGMVMLSYAAVPLYQLFCQVTGYGGTTQTATTVPDTIHDRTITVRFNTDTSPNLPWDFKSDQKQLDVRVGESTLTSFSATNQSEQLVVGTSIYNVTPHKAGEYFFKTECFCYEEQSLSAGQTTHFPVSFFIDPEIMDDPKMDDVKTITLSYTFFPAKNADKIAVNSYK